jgi:hypothetical protein
LECLVGWLELPDSVEESLVRLLETRDFSGELLLRGTKNRGAFLPELLPIFGEHFELGLEGLALPPEFCALAIECQPFIIQSLTLDTQFSSHRTLLLEELETSAVKLGMPVGEELRLLCLPLGRELGDPLLDRTEDLLAALEETSLGLGSERFELMLASLDRFLPRPEGRIALIEIAFAIVEGALSLARGIAGFV